MIFFNPYRFGGGGGGAIGPIQPIALAYRADTALVSDGDPIPFDNEVYDNEGVFAPTSGNFVIPSDGLYRMSMVASHTTTEAVKQGVNGSWPSVAYGDACDLTSPFWRSGLSAPLALSSGDNAQMLAAYGSINLGQNGGFYSAASIERLDAATKYAIVKRSSTLSSFTSGTISWETEYADTGSFWTSGSPTRFTVPSGVTRVRLTANVECSTASTYAQVEMRKNGARVDGCTTKITGRGAPRLMNVVSAPVEVSEGDYFELYVLSGSATTINASNFFWFSIEEVPATHVCALVKSTTSQDINSSADTAMSFTSAVYDDDSMWSAGSPTRVTVPAGVSYARVAYNMLTSGGSNNSASSFATKNGSTFAGLAADKCDNNVNGTKHMAGVSAWVPVSEGDYFELTGKTIGANIPILSCWLALECV